MQIDLSSDLLEHDELDLLLWIWDFSFHTVVITKSEWLDRDNGNLYLTEAKQWLAFYLYLLMFVIPNSPNHITMSASVREWAWRRVYSLLVDIVGSNRYILLLFTITPHLKDGCSSFFHGGCDIGLDFDLALKSQVYIVWKFHIVGRLRRIMLSFSRLRELSSLLALVLHLAIGISHFIWGESKADSFQMEDMLACDTNVSLLLLGMKCLRGISWSQ